MPASIGVNLRVTGHCSQGGRKYMEDLFSVAYQQTEDERDLEYAFFGIYDGHGGSEAAAFAKEHLMDSIVKQRQFWSDNDEDVLKAIRNGYMLTHLNMWKELEKWPKTVTGLPSTAGTTASVAFIRRGKIYIGHVGDSAIILGYQKDGSEEWAAKPLTLDHKPESVSEMERIRRCGGKVISKAGVPRVVWNRPRLGHKGPIKRNTPMDEIPFLAVARSLGDLWSYNPANDEFIVSPDPDVGVLNIDPTKFRCLIFGTDGLWNMISPEGAVCLVQATERHNEAALVGATTQPRDWLNPSKSLVDHALERWSNTRMRADNTSVVTLMLDPPGPPRATVLRSRTAARVPPPPVPASDGAGPSDPPAVPQNGLTIMTRYSDMEKPEDKDKLAALPPCASLDTRFSLPPPEGAAEGDSDDDAITNYGNPAESYFMARLLNRTRIVNTLSEVYEEIVHGVKPEPEGEPAAGATETGDAAEGDGDGDGGAETVVPAAAGEAPHAGAGDEAAPSGKEDGRIQINEVSSSSPTEAPPKERKRRVRPRAGQGGDAATAAHTRVLRSHHEPEPPAPPRDAPAARAPATRRPPAERVVILSRRAPARAPAPAPPEPAEAPRATRSAAACAPLAQKITRSISNVARELRAAAAGGGARAGNCPRAPGPQRRAPAARPHSKENLGARCRARSSRAAPAEPRPRQPRRADSPEVHSTTPECAPPAPAPATRALRSRNEPQPPAGAPPGKRPRTDAPKPPAPKALGKRPAGPWAPGLALRNRLRKRLAK